MAAYTATPKMRTSSTWVSGPKWPTSPISGLLAISLASAISTIANTNGLSARSASTMRVKPRDLTAGAVGSLETPLRFAARARWAFRVPIPSLVFPLTGALRCSATSVPVNAAPREVPGAATVELASRDDRVGRGDRARAALDAAGGRQSGRGQRRRIDEGRRAAEVHRVEQVARVRVAIGERRQVPLGLDELQHRRVVVDAMRDVALARVR